MYQVIEEVHQVLQHQVLQHQVLPQVQVKVLVEGEPQGEIKMGGYIIIVLLVLVVVCGYWLFFGGEEY
jgi:hypothetical protein